MSIDLMGDMDSIFLDNGFEETITAIPSTGSPASIKAQVFRGGIDNIKQFKNLTEILVKYEVEIYVSRTDVPIARVNEYKFQLKKKISDASVTNFIVSSVLREDEGALMLGLS
jgi:hypothetical protein